MCSWPRAGQGGCSSCAPARSPRCSPMICRCRSASASSRPVPIRAASTWPRARASCVFPTAAATPRRGGRARGGGAAPAGAAATGRAIWRSRRTGERMFVSVGSASNVGTEMSPPAAGGVRLAVASASARPGATSRTGRTCWSLDPDGANLRGVRDRPAQLRRARRSSRAPARCGASTNERDGLGDNLPPDYVTRGAGGRLLRLAVVLHRRPRGSAAARAERPDLAGKVTVPDVLIQPHSAPLGHRLLRRRPHVPARVSRRRLRGAARLVEPRPAHRLQGDPPALPRRPPTGEYEDFLTGFVIADRAVWGRPVGVAVDKDGALLVSEDGNGTVWRVNYKP